MPEQDSAVSFTEAGARRIIESILREEGLVRNDMWRRRRHVTLLGGGGGGALFLFRLEEELQCGKAADARLMDQCELVTLPGEKITVMDDEHKWFGRGNPAPSGDAGGDNRVSGSSYSNCGWATRVTGCSDDVFYSIVSMGTWYRWIEGILSSGQETNPWRVLISDVSAGWDGDGLSSGQEIEYTSKFVRPDDVQESGAGGEYLTLAGVCVDPVDGMHFKAVFDEIVRQYKVVTICCTDS